MYNVYIVYSKYSIFQVRGGEGGGNLDKIQKKSSFFSGDLPFLSLVFLPFKWKIIGISMLWREIVISLELADMQLSLSNFSVFSSFCLFIFLSFGIFIFLSFCLPVFLSILIIVNKRACLILFHQFFLIIFYWQKNISWSKH